MKTSIISTLSLLTTAVSGSWRAISYRGQQCTGERLTTYENSGEISFWCAELKFSGSTSSILIINSEDAEKTFEFELHHDDVCQDLNFGHFKCEFHQPPIPRVKLLLQLSLP